MADDIAPQLIESVTEEFHRLYANSSTVQNLLKKVKQGSATYAEAQEYSLEVSKLIGTAYQMHVSSAVLPDGKMYYNIASRLIPASLDENYELVSDYAVKVQQALNDSAGVGLKAQSASLNQDRVDGLVDMVSNADQYDDVASRLLSAIENFSQNVVDETIKENAGFHYQAGLSPKIVRKATWKCCDWCNALVGSYSYPDIPQDVYRRHENCRCTVLYDPADGSKNLQNVHSKRWTQSEQGDTIKENKLEAFGNSDVFRPNDCHSNIQKYVTVDQKQVAADAKAGGRHSGVYVDAESKTRKQLQKSVISRMAQVELHAEKMAHPEQYVADWNMLSEIQQAGLIHKWEKDMHRNAEQAEIELVVFKERF